MNLKSIIKIFLKSGFQWIVVPIRSGELKGKLWTVSSSSRIIKGNYDRKVIDLFINSIQPGEVVYDVGAHMGYYTLVASQTVGSHGQVIAFEPLPFNLRQLRRHVGLNRCHNVTVIGAGVGATAGTEQFTNYPGSGKNRLCDKGGLQVQVVTLDDLVKAGTIPLPHCIKVDVEGNEFAVLQGAKSIINKARPVLFISFHGQELREQCSALLHSWSYQRHGNVWRPEPLN